MIRNWLKIARSQTAAAVIMLCGIFFLLGGGNFLSFLGIGVIVFSILIHDFSFAHNTAFDVLTGYDTEDEYKKHFPVCDGSVDPFDALKITHIGIFIMVFFAMLLSYFGTGNAFLAMSFFAIFLMSGFWYNEWTSKIATWDFVPISICFTSLSVFVYFLVSDEINLLMILSAIYIFLVEWYEIGIAGEIKEAEMTKEVSLLRNMGMACKKHDVSGEIIFDMHNAVYYPFFLKIISLLVILAIIGFYTFTWGTLAIFLILGTLMLVVNNKLTDRQLRNRNKSLRHMACGEILAIFLLPLILYPVVGLLEVLFLLFFSLSYFLVMNKINWGTWVRPQV